MVGTLWIHGRLSGRGYAHTYPASSWFLLRQTREKPLRANIRSFEVTAVQRPASFPGSLFSASLGRLKKDPGCGWSHDHPESGWQKNLLGGRGSRVLCLVDVTNFVGFKSSSSR